MRKAFIGLSTPIGFDYANQASKTLADSYSSPNPILDSPFGLMLLFDELVFLTRSLCPENMRGLPFVSFLDEQGRLPDLTEEEISSALYYGGNYESIHCVQKIPFREAIEKAGATEEMNIDNHSHGLNIGAIRQQANASLTNFAIDMLVCSKLVEKNIEIIANSRIQPIYEKNLLASEMMQLTELLVLDNIPNYLTPKGPYHPVIDEIRDNKFLVDFRRWILQTNSLTSKKEVFEMKKEVEHALQFAQDEVFLKYLDPKRHFTSVGKAMLGDAIGVAFPLTGTVTALAEAGIDLARNKNQRWQGFLVGARHEIRKSLK
ncbi:MAG: hypothetical protein V4660_07670 [Pseudomonadota bacterium]